MLDSEFETSVFINCPFDPEYAPLLEAAVFCVIHFGLTPRLASESVETGENRFDKIVSMIRESKFSIHDLSRCKSSVEGQSEELQEFHRMNMPFELGVDFGLRRSNVKPYSAKKFLIMERDQYDLKRALSDLAGQDVAHHQDNYQLMIKSIRDFFRVEAELEVPGPTKIDSDYATFLAWMMEKKIHEGHTEDEAKNLPTRERMDEMTGWVASGKPDQFQPD